MKNLIYLFFSWFISFLIKKDFSGFSFNNVEVDKDKAILLIANHFSWWDGFLMFHLNKVLFKRKFHVMVSEENYKEVFFLKYLGAFPVKKKSRDMFKSLKYAGELLNDKDNLLLVFPQGKLHSGHVPQLRFEKGLLHLVNSSGKTFQYLFAATFVDYFEKRKPLVSCYLKVWSDADYSSLQRTEGSYNTHYQTSREKQCRKTV